MIKELTLPRLAEIGQTGKGSESRSSLSDALEKPPRDNEKQDSDTNSEQRGEGSRPSGHGGLNISYPRSHRAVDSRSGGARTLTISESAKTARASHSSYKKSLKRIHDNSRKK